MDNFDYELRIPDELIAEAVRSLERSYFPIYARKQLRKCRKLIDSNLYGLTEREFQTTVRQVGQMIDELRRSPSVSPRIREEINDVDWLVHFVVAEHRFLAGPI